MPHPVVELHEAGVWVDTPTAWLVHPVTWNVLPGQHWAVLGANGAGKSTLLSVVGAVRQPSVGSVKVLGHQFGRTDLRLLRSRIGTVDARQRIPGDLPLTEVVLTGATGSVQPVPVSVATGGDAASTEEAQRRRATDLLELMGLGDRVRQSARTCSSGERARLCLARALMPDPPLLLLDEPAAGLDLPGRELLLSTVTRLAAGSPERATISVTHHLEELPEHTSHALLLRGGRTVACGTVENVLTEQLLSECYGLPLEVSRSGGRWAVRARPGQATRAVTGSSAP